MEFNKMTEEKFDWMDPSDADGKRRVEQLGICSINPFHDVFMISRMLTKFSINKNLSEM